MPTYLQKDSVLQPIRPDETITISRAIESCYEVQCYRPYGRVMGEDALESGSRLQQSTNQMASLESSKPEEFPPYGEATAQPHRNLSPFSDITLHRRTCFMPPRASRSHNLPASVQAECLGMQNIQYQEATPPHVCSRHLWA